MKIRQMKLLVEPWEEYHAKRNECVTAHSLATFRRCPLEFIMERRGELVTPDNPAFAIGRAAHTLILEGEAALQEQYTIGAPINPKTQRPYGKDTKAYGEWLAEQTKPVISPDDLELMTAMRESVQNHDEACLLLGDGVAEGVLRGEWCGVQCQSRLDWYNPELCAVVDLKTCEDLDRFEYDARRYEYPEQVAGFYAGFARHCEVEVAAEGVYIIAVEKRKPNRTGVWRFSAASSKVLVERTESGLRVVAKALEQEMFPTRYEEIRWM